MNDMNPLREHELLMTRRHFFGRSALGLGTAALANLMGPGSLNGATASGGIHHKAKAKHVIYLFMSGGPSHLDTWDHKPKMQDLFNEQLPEHIRGGQRVTGMTANQKNGLPLAKTFLPRHSG